MAAIIAKRPVVARFRLTKKEWGVFYKFYENNPTGILTSKELDISKRCPGAHTYGHAVVFTSYNSACFYLMNSKGPEWGHMGFFRVRNAEVLQLKFIDVFWTEDILTCEEKAYYKEYGADEAKKFIENLKGLQESTYQCPICKQTSKVTKYSGHLLSVKCPKCYGEFDSKKEGNILALNLYLTLLSR